MLEINTKSFLRRGCFFPDQKYFYEIHQLNIPVLVNSDAHSPNLISVGRREALTALLEHGFHSVWELHAGKWMEVPIDITE
jgi:histidinol-phosphatase (PHP family)